MLPIVYLPRQIYQPVYSPTTIFAPVLLTLVIFPAVADVEFTFEATAKAYAAEPKAIGNVTEDVPFK